MDPIIFSMVSLTLSGFALGLSVGVMIGKGSSKAARQ